MSDFFTIYNKLNSKQQLAVDTTDGPLLVLAGPGTGKTQLLSARVANILRTTDTLAQNILCLTFTESGARNMRERLSSMIGDQAYNVHISTYHSFGSDIIKKYPHYFSTVSLHANQDTRLEKPIDDLTKTRIVQAIVESLPFEDPLRSATYYIKSVVGTLSEIKRNNLDPQQLLTIASDNLLAVQQTSDAITNVYGGVARIPKLEQAIVLFESILGVLQQHSSELCIAAATALQTALQQAQESGKTTPLTAFKNEWLHKNSSGTWELAGQDASLKLVSMARIYQLYQQALAAKSLYDFDDMILRTIDAMQSQPELLYTLQETYQYILLDEFQDTNPSQFELVKLLTNNPVHEGRPNIMAVGDDDQAIYAFQGADVGNMQAFLRTYSDVVVINLEQNYRSHSDVLLTAQGVASQIASRLHYSLQDITKNSIASSTQLPKSATILRQEFSAEADEYAWIASTVSNLIQSGTPAQEIAVLSPKHAKLEKLVPFLNHVNVPVTYEKREDILQTPLIRMLTQMSQLVVSLAQQNMPQANSLFPTILSYDFFGISVETIWNCNWQAASHNQTKNWTQLALEDPALQQHVRFFLKLAALSTVEPLEYIMDYLTGTQPLAIDEQTTYTCPLKAFYFSSSKLQTDTLQFYEALSHLSVIRSKLRDYQDGSDSLLLLSDFLDFVSMYQLAEQPLINSHPLAQAANSVQLMTVYKAKGLEFSHVFLINMHDDVWGKKARSNSNKIGLPANLQYIRYQGSSEDELLRLLFVAITRAKHGLYVTSFATTDSGKATEPVKYMQEVTEGETRTSSILPSQFAGVHKNSHTGIQPEVAVQLLWQHKHTALTPTLEGLLQDRLASYKMSPTHVNTYIDTEYGGPEAFLLRTLLRFPQAPTPDSEFGNAVHASLDAYQKMLLAGQKPSIKSVLSIFDTQIKSRYIPKKDIGHYTTKGHHALTTYILARKDMFANINMLSEVDFSKEGVLLDSVAHITGKIDRIEINKQLKTIEVVDFKTGKSVTKWEKELKYLKYRQQLYFYKLLIEGSHTFKSYTVTSGRLEFVEPDATGKVAQPLVVDYDEAELAQQKKLILAVWNNIQTLQFAFPKIYTPDYKGATAFITDITA